MSGPDLYGTDAASRGAPELERELAQANAPDDEVPRIAPGSARRQQRRKSGRAPPDRMPPQKPGQAPATDEPTRRKVRIDGKRFARVGSSAPRESIAGRPMYPPDYVSIETLAYRLDCTLGEIEMLLGSGHLPTPAAIAGLVRWDFGLVRATIERQNARPRKRMARNGQPAVESDPYLAGVERGKTG